jgi:pyruvyl transferase EpsO
VAGTFNTADTLAPGQTHGGSLGYLKLRLARLLDLLPIERPLVYLDYPVHMNFGDLLIMRGTERFFADCGHRVVARAAYLNFVARARRRISREAIIVMHGGGNFGDLYPVHQNFREEVVRRFPDNRIVILPQSVYFSSPLALARSGRIFRQHPDLALCVRDHASLAQVRGKFTENAILMPDMAHQLWRGSQPHPSAGGRTLRLLRTDVEAVEYPQQAAAQHRTLDWLDFVPRWSCRIFGRILWLHALEGKVDRGLGAHALWHGYRDVLHRYMESRFHEFDEVITSRLHGMIFALLLGKRVRYLDNLYGKLNGYARTWFDTSVPVAPYHVGGAD